MRVLTMAAAALAFALAACDRASEAQCEDACLHYSKLGLAEKEGVEPGSEAHEEAWASVQDREELRDGLHHCTTLCQGQATADQTACILEAETVERADACSGVSRAESDKDE